MMLIKSNDLWIYIYCLNHKELGLLFIKLENIMISN
jgi:hypothetical protein